MRPSLAWPGPADPECEMIVDHELGLTILGRCGLPPARLVVENTRSWEWESLPRREPRRARERLGPLKPTSRPSKP